MPELYLSIKIKSAVVMTSTDNIEYVQCNIPMNLKSMDSRNLLTLSYPAYKCTTIKKSVLLLKKVYYY